MGGKIVRISDFGPKFTLNFGEDSRIFEGLGPPPIKNPGYAYGPPPCSKQKAGSYPGGATRVFVAQRDSGLLAQRRHLRRGCTQ